MNDQPTTPSAAPSADQYQAQMAQVIAHYQQQQLHAHLLGPGISLMVHAIGFVLLMALLLQTPPTAAPPTPPERRFTFIVPHELDPRAPVPPDLPPPTADPATGMAVPQAPLDPPVEVEGRTDEPLDGNYCPGEPPEFGPEPVPVDGGNDGGNDLAPLPGPTALPSTSPMHLTGLLASRASKAKRDDAVRRSGGSRQGQEAVEKCLAWLATVQRPNGSWEDSPAHTGLALLVFMAHGETPLSDKYGDTTKLGLQWLARTVENSPCDPPNYGQRAYGEGIAVYALADAYAMTHIPFLKTAMERGLAGIIKGQQPGGGFNYGYDQSARWDLSVAGWQFQALQAAAAAGATTPGLPAAIDKACDFLKHRAYADGKFGYSSPGSGGNMTGVGATCLILLGERNTAQVKAACATIAAERLALYQDFLAGRKDWRQEAGASLYGWYYDTKAMCYGTPGGGKQWAAWRQVYDPVLTKNQHPDGYWEVAKGSGLDASPSGRILASCWCALQLEVSYQYAPAAEYTPLTRTTTVRAPSDDGGLLVQ